MNIHEKAELNGKQWHIGRVSKGKRRRGRAKIEKERQRSAEGLGRQAQKARQWWQRTKNKARGSKEMEGTEGMRTSWFPPLWCSLRLCISSSISSLLNLVSFIYCCSQLSELDYSLPPPIPIPPSQDAAEDSLRPQQWEVIWCSCGLSAVTGPFPS